ncbi:MAG TPA: hypothetical protein VMV66_02250 [Candidatus Humimicrobiaceae bacterium]|nr:hypothetical protein [Candidatus Humimicrobiaceae bacterium]
MVQDTKKEDRATRFKRVAQRRTENILNSLRVLGNCSNKSSYQYTDEDVVKIFRAIEEQLRITKMKFRSSRRQKFSL